MHPAFGEKLRQVNLTLFFPSIFQLLIAKATALKIPHQPKGTLMCVEGPRFSTRAESNLFRQWGADVVGMTTHPEVCKKNLLIIKLEIMRKKILIQKFQIPGNSGQRVGHSLRHCGNGD